MRVFKSIGLFGLVFVTLAGTLQGLANNAFAQRRSADETSRIIELEVNAGARAEIEIQQRWMEVLSDVGVDRVRSRTSRVVEIPEVKESRIGSTVVVRVTGSISGRNLILPNGKYSLRDKARLRDFFKKLRDDGSKVTLAEKKAFGLTSEQLVSVHQSLATPLSIQTKDQLVAKIVKHMIDQSRIEFVMSRATMTVLQADGSSFSDEIQGLSYGTAMAAVLRPLGLVLVPRRVQGERVKLHIVDARSANEHWPVGWPSDQAILKTVPKLGKREKMSIRDFKLSAAFNALQKRVGIPFIYDQNSLARGGVDLDNTKISLVRDQVSYIVAIQNIARQTKPRMRAELRLDENGKPFLWMTTANRVR